MKKLLALFIGTIFSYSSFAQSDIYSEQVESVFQNTKEVYFQFEVTSVSEINELTKIISIDNVTGNTVKAFANKKGYQKFLKYNYQHTFLLLPKQLAAIQMPTIGQPLKQNRIITSYPTYSQYEAMMQQFATDYPTLCQFYDLGTLPSGRKILALKITDNPAQEEDEPEFFYTSTMHGDETAGYPMMLSLIEHLLQNYGTDARVTSLVNNMEIWINPLANPDGTYAGGNNTVAGATRSNANGVDINRNFPDPEDGLHPDGEVWQPETIIFMGFADTMDFVMSANFHGGVEVFNFPWDTWNHVHPDQNWWVREGRKYADTAQLNSPAGYMDDLFSGSYPGVTNGFAWYEVNGGRQDYMQWYHQCHEATIELSTQKLLSSSQLGNHFTYNLRSLLNYMETSLRGIRGIVTDQCTGLPVRAKVFITSHDFDSSFVYSTSDVGDYHRTIYTGTYNLVFSAPGYQSVTVPNVNVATFTSSTVVNVQLIPNAPVAGFTASGPSGCIGEVSFTDLTGSAASWLWDFGDGNTSTDQNPTHLYTTDGTYSVSLTVTNCAGTDTDIQTNLLSITVATPPVTVNDTAATCNPTSLTLSATGSGTLNWYDAPTGGNLVNTGNTYTTPALTSNTSYWVESSNLGGSQYVGAVNTSIGGGGYYTNTGSHYLIFDATQAFTLISVQVDAGAAGNRTIQLRDNGGNVIQQTTVNLPSGVSTVNLNFNVPVGTNMQLGVGVANSNLYRNSTGGSYPYTLSGIVSIHSNSAGNNNYYYYFYNWEIATVCASSLTEVTAVFPDPSGNAGVSITSTNSSVCEGDDITFDAAGTNEGSSPVYDWQVNGSSVGNGSSITLNNLNDGDVVTCVLTSSEPCLISNTATSNSVNVTIFPVPATPVITQTGNDLQSDAVSDNQWYLDGVLIPGATGVTYTPAQNGAYFVIVTDTNGCSSDTSNVIQFIGGVGIEEIKGIDFSYYPNPAENLVTFVNKTGEKITIELFDNLGRLVQSLTATDPITSVGVNGFSKGIYYIRVSTPDSSGTGKLFIR